MPATVTAEEPSSHSRREPARSASHGTSRPVGSAASPKTAASAPAVAALQPRSWKASGIHDTKA